MKSYVGGIVLLKHVIFKTVCDEKRCVIDHAYNQGRPALVIHETEDKLYHLLITSKEWRHIEDCKETPLPDDLSIFNGFVKFNEIHSRSLCMEEVHEYVSDEYLLDVLKKLCIYQQSHMIDDEYLEIRDNLIKKIKELRCKKTCIPVEEKVKKFTLVCK